MLLNTCTAWSLFSSIAVLLFSPPGFLYCWYWLRGMLASSVSTITAMVCFYKGIIQRKLRARWVHRITQNIPSWEEPTKTTPGSTQDHKSSNHMYDRVVQTLLELWQSQCCDHCPGKHVPVPEHPLVKNLFLQPNPVLLWHSSMPFPGVSIAVTREKRSFSLYLSSSSLHLWQNQSSCCSAALILLSLPPHHLNTSVWANIEACRSVWYSSLYNLWIICSSFLSDCML